MTPVDAAAIRDGADAPLIGHEIIVVDETASANDLLFEKTGVATAEGLVMFAESQTAGRGQRGNRWISSPRLGLWFSILLRPRLGLEQSQRLTCWLAERIAASMRAQFALEGTI